MKTILPQTHVSIPMPSVLPPRLPAPVQGNAEDERCFAIRLARYMLDRPSADHDDDLAVLSRQFLRAIGEI